VYCATNTCWDVAVEGKRHCQRHAHQGGELTLYYWPLAARVSAILRMLDESKTPFTWKTDRADIAPVSSGWGAPTDTYAPPILKDGNSLISQSLAVTAHIGARTGYDLGISCPIKALQYMADAYDFAECVNSHSKCVEEINKFVKAPEAGKISWLDEWLTNFERSIKGPFYFGNRPTYVDFWTTQAFEWAEFVLLKPFGHTLEKYPKLSAMLAGVRPLGLGGLAGKPVLPDHYAPSAELIAACKATC